MGDFGGSRVLGLIVELFLKSSVVLAAGILGSRLLRGRGASLRHFLLSLSLLCLALLPAFSVLSPGWPARWLPAWAAAEYEPDARRTEALVADRPALDFRRGYGKDRAALELPSPDSGRPPGGARPPRMRALLASGLPALWLSGLVLLLARLTAGLCGARRLTREGKALEDSGWQRLLHRFISAVRLKRKIDIKAHPRVIVPLTWGFRRPVVIMPDGARVWTEEERSSALFHELSHVKRGDFLVMLLVRLSLAVFWLNPLCWIALRMLKGEQEKACDELVLKAGIRPSTYANNLLSFKRFVQTARSPLAILPGVLGMFGRSEFHERLLVILGRKTAFKEVPMKTKFAVSVLAFLAVAFIGLARPQAASAIPDTGLVAVDAAVAAGPAAVQETPAQEAPKSQEKPKKEEPKPGEPQKKEEKVTKEVKVVVEGKNHGEEPVEITISDGKTEKTIKLDRGVIVVRKGEDGRTILVSPEGKEIAVVEGEGTQIKIKGGRMIFGKAKVLEPAGEPKVFTVIEGDKKTSWLLDEDKKLHTVTFKSRPHLEIVKEVEEPEHITIKHKGGEFTLAKRLRLAEPVRHLHAEEEELQKKIAETQAVLKKIEEQKLAESDLPARKEALRELQESLQALQEELNKASENLKTLKVVAEPRIHVTREPAEAPEVEEITPEKESPENIITITRNEEAYTVVMTMKLKDNAKETYEKAVAKLEKELPEGYKLEPKLDEKSGTMVIKITGRRGTEETREKIQKLVEGLAAELKK